MGDTQFIQWATSLGVGGVLAAGMFLYHRRDMKGYTQTLEKLCSQWEKHDEALMAVIADNSAAMARNTATIDALHRRFDRTEEALTKLGFTFPHREEPRKS